MYPQIFTTQGTLGDNGPIVTRFGMWVCFDTGMIMVESNDGKKTRWSGHIENSIPSKRNSDTNLCAGMF